MKKSILFLATETAVILTIYILLLFRLAGTNIIASMFCPGPHLPSYYPVLIGIFLFCRLYIVLLPGLWLSRIGYAWLKHRRSQRSIRF